MSDIVHYMHYNKLWYYWLDNKKEKKYWRKINDFSDDIHLLSEDIISERQCLNILRSMFPFNEIMKALPYHFSPSNHGSRPVKHTVNRKKELKEKIQFQEYLKN